MKIDVDFSALNRAVAKIHGPDYTKGYDDGYAGAPFQDASATDQVEYRRGYEYATKLRREAGHG